MPAMPVTRQDARNALGNMRRGGTTGADPNNDQQVELYLNMRRQYARVRPQAFIARLRQFLHAAPEEAQVTTDVGTKFILSYWGVPKENFPGGLPQALLSFEVTDEELEMAELEGGGSAQVARDAFYVVQQTCERTSLGNNVRTLNFYQTSDTRLSTRRAFDLGGDPNALPAGGATGAGPDDNVPGAASAGFATGASPNATGGAPRQLALPEADCTNAQTRGTKRAISDPAEPSEEPAAQRQRVLKETLGGLRDGIRVAAASERWYSENPLNQETVKALTAEVIAALSSLNIQESAQASVSTMTNKGRAAALAEKVGKFLSKLFLENASAFNHLRHFKDLWTDVAGSIKDSPPDIDPEGDLIQKLAIVPVASSDAPDLSGADVVTRTVFRRSPLYREGFIIGRVHAMLATGRDENVKAWQRKECLELVLSLGPTDKNLSFEAEVALTVLDDKMDVSTRLSYVLGEKDHIEILRKYDSKSVLAVADELMQENPNLKKYTVKEYVEAAVEIFKADVTPANPVIADAVAFVGNVLRAAEDKLPHAPTHTHTHTHTHIYIYINT